VAGGIEHRGLRSGVAKRSVRRPTRARSPSGSSRQLYQRRDDRSRHPSTAARSRHRRRCRPRSGAGKGGRPPVRRVFCRVRTTTEDESRSGPSRCGETRPIEANHRRVLWVDAPAEAGNAEPEPCFPGRFSGFRVTPGGRHACVALRHCINHRAAEGGRTAVGRWGPGPGCGLDAAAELPGPVLDGRGSPARPDLGSANLRVSTSWMKRSNRLRIGVAPAPVGATFFQSE